MELPQIVEFVFMLVIDMMFLVTLVLLMLPLGIWRQAAFAVMKRNFIGYFSNPTGYVFLCLFVLLTSFAAFWPHEFFTTNLANFDQLNKFLPYIMLIFIPAITMSIWAEERRQGTDELLLTLPAKDFDIVIGKYFAAVLVFTVSLLFSQLSNYAVLLAMTGGALDNLLLFSTYLGYWFVGVAMISLGMVASFLTSNLTVGFIIGATLNAPLAFFSNADVIFSNSKWIQRLFDWSLLQRFEPFGRGLISASSIFYFIGLVVIGVYLSMILIGRRHWLGGRDGTSMLWHFVLRAAFLVVMVVGVVLVVQHSPLNRLRMDISERKISTLAPSTTALLEKLAQEVGENDKPIKIEAYVSDNIPSEYVKTKYDLVNLLREFDVLGGKRIDVNLYQGIRPFSPEAILAEKKYNIRPQTVRSESRGAVKPEEVILGVAFSSGLERVVIPFMPYGAPVEYELMRSINTVSKSERKTIGVLQTDALIMGAQWQTQEGDYRIPPLAILSELRKQYNLENVDASSPIELWSTGEDGTLQRRYDALLVVQPSQTTPVEMENLINAIQSGQPVAIFEDPLPMSQSMKHVQPTFFPRRIPRSDSGQANIQKLWDALDLDIDRQRRAVPQRIAQQFAMNGKMPTGSQLTQYSSFLVWQMASENPYKRDNTLNQEEHLVIRNEPGLAPLFADHPATNGIQEIYLQGTGYLQAVQKAALEFEPLVNTGIGGRIQVFDYVADVRSEARNRLRGSANTPYTIAGHIHGSMVDEPLPTDAAAFKPSKQRTNVIYVCDVDTLSDFFVASRAAPIRNSVEYRFQNMSFVLNIIDSLVKETTYLGIRNRRVDHVTLAVVEETYETAMQKVYEMDQELTKDYDTSLNAARNEVMEKLRPLQTTIEKEQRKQAKAAEANEPYDPGKLEAMKRLLSQEIQEKQAKFKAKEAELQNERREKKRQIELDAELEIQEIQRKFKLAAVLIPPIPPLLVGLVVFTRRRLREREGISKARRLK
ncbi:MAG: Gldg family protein [Mariniblastus sp.]